MLAAIEEIFEFVPALVIVGMALYLIKGQAAS